VSLESLYLDTNQLTGSLELSLCNRAWNWLSVDCLEVTCSCCDCA
jgi:hypothetical protein